MLFIFQNINNFSTIPIPLLPGLSEEEKRKSSSLWKDSDGQLKSLAEEKLIEMNNLISHVQLPIALLSSALQQHTLELFEFKLLELKQ